MNTKQNELFNQLRNLIAQLGQDGGKISPSIYDTAQRLRFYPPVEGVDPGLAWLLEQQRADGGWCDPAVPAARDASTLAAILALKQVRRDRAAQRAIEAGLAFLRVQAPQWADIPLDGLPIAVEVILPRLIAEANAAGLAIDPTPYARLYKLGQKKLERISQVKNVSGTPAAYSWEAYGNDATLVHLDAVHSVGHSPAATAKWLQLAHKIPELSSAVEQAEAYLESASQATDVDIPGVVPVIFPVTGFELCYGPNALMLTGLLSHESFQNELTVIMEKLIHTLMTENGVSSGIKFVPDVDDTAVAMSLLKSCGQDVDPEYVMQFYRGDHFFTFAHELNPSVFSNAHAVHALATCGERVWQAERFLLSRQTSDGSWPADKWHCSWRFTTLETISALAQTNHLDAVHKGVMALLNGQNQDGSWSFNHHVSGLDTAYSIMGLVMAARMGLSIPNQEASIQRGHNWLIRDGFQLVREERRWLSKELYSIPKVEQAYLLSALAVSATPRSETPYDEERHALQSEFVLA